MANATTPEKTNLFDIMVDQSLQNLKTACWLQEQGEKMTRSWMEHNQTVRDETLKVAGRVVEQVKQSNRQWVEFTQAAVQTTMEAYRAPQAAFFEKMARAAAKN